MIFALYHSAGETVGLIGDVLKELHLPFKGVHLYEGEGLPRDTSDLEGLIVMGGPMNVDDVDTFPFLLPEVQLIEKVLREKKPVLGICLGAQLMAKALGEKVFPNKTKEVGWHPVRLTENAKKDLVFKRLPASIEVVHWHGDTFNLPKDTVHLAETDACRSQAFRWGDKAYGLQFHLEATPSMLTGWCRAKSEQGFIKAAGENAKEIIAVTRDAYEELEPLARQFFSSYFKSAYSHLLATA